MQELGLMKIFTWKYLTNWRPVLLVFPRAQSSFECVFNISSCSYSGLNLCTGRWQVPFSSRQGPYRLKHLIMVSGETHVHSVPWFQECSFPGLWRFIYVFFFNVLILDYALKIAKIMNHICLTSSLLWSRKIFPLVASSPYLELHYYNHWSHMELYIIFLLEARSYIW